MHVATAPENQQAGRLHEPWRSNALARFVRQARGLKWSRPLFLLLLEELYVGDEFDALVGPPEKLPVKRYPEAIAVAIALRHSWRPDDLTAVVLSLGRFARSRRRSVRTSA